MVRAEEEKGLLSQLNRTVETVRGGHGAGGCYMELLDLISRTGTMYTAVEFMFPEGRYESAMHELMAITNSLPPLQSPEILEESLGKVQNTARLLTTPEE